MPEASVEPVNLASAAQQYLQSLRPEARQDQTPEVNRFTGWIGQDRLLSSLRGSELEEYALRQQTAANAQRRLEVVRTFLGWVKKQNLTVENLATHIRLRKTGSGAAAGDALNPDQIHVTAEGRAALEAELERRRAERPNIADQLRTAMADKDFRENAPLDAAREAQAHLEARIRELESMLKRAVVVDRHGASGVARMGSRVRLLDLENQREHSFTLVGPGEVNAKENKISVSSPVGKALIDRTAGEEVEVNAPSKTYRYRIEAVES